MVATSASFSRKRLERALRICWSEAIFSSTSVSHSVRPGVALARNSAKRERAEGQGHAPFDVEQRHAAAAPCAKCFTEQRAATAEHERAMRRQRRAGEAELGARKQPRGPQRHERTPAGRGPRIRPSGPVKPAAFQRGLESEVAPHGEPLALAPHADAHQVHAAAAEPRAVAATAHHPPPTDPPPAVFAAPPGGGPPPPGGGGGAPGRAGPAAPSPPRGRARAGRPPPPAGRPPPSPAASSGSVQGNESRSALGTAVI